MKIFQEAQSFLEETYGINTGLNVSEFIRPLNKLDNLGKLVIDQSNVQDPGVALLLDQDIFEAWCSFEDVNTKISENHVRTFSVVCEELSHFVYFAYNHQRGRNITALEMEMQSEIDRLLFAFHSNFPVDAKIKEKLFFELNETAYDAQLGPRYEESRLTAKNFVKTLKKTDPNLWGEKEFENLRAFFHNDLPGKIQLSKNRKIK